MDLKQFDGHTPNSEGFVDDADHIAWMGVSASDGDVMIEVRERDAGYTDTGGWVAANDVDLELMAAAPALLARLAALEAAARGVVEARYDPMPSGDEEKQLDAALAKLAALVEEPKC